MKKTRFSLNGLHLKIVGWALTLCMAVCFTLFPWEYMGTDKLILYYLGYCSVPIFAFLLTEGFEYTDSIKKYLLWTGIAAVAAEIPYDFACTGKLFDFSFANGQNLMFAIFLGLLQLLLLRSMGTETFGRKLGCGILILSAAVWTWLMNIPAGFYLQVCIGIFYLLREKKIAMSILFALAAIFMAWPSIFALPLILMYDGYRGRYPKWIFYGGWVALWVIFAILRLLGV